MQHVVIVIHLMLVLALIGVVLLQKSEGGGLGIGSAGGFMTSRGTANVLTRATAVLAALFFATSLVLSILAGMNRKPATIIQGGQGAPTAPGPASPTDASGILKQLQGAPAAPPAAPAVPSAPQVPQSK
jgi:preprotein translocase subunit SecG